MECSCGHASDKWAEIKKYGFGSKLENETLCPACWYLTCFCNVEIIKKKSPEMYQRLKKDAERKVEGNHDRNNH